VIVGQFWRRKASELECVRTISSPFLPATLTILGAVLYCDDKRPKSSNSTLAAPKCFSFPLKNNQTTFLPPVESKRPLHKVYNLHSYRLPEVINTGRNSTTKDAHLAIVRLEI
jgi:hypothetical protein